MRHMARRRKVIGIENKPNYVVEDFKNPPEDEVIGYRRKRVDGHLLTLAILKDKGPRGGRTVVTSVWHPKTEKKASNQQVTKALRRRRKAVKA